MVGVDLYDQHVATYRIAFRSKSGIGHLSSMPWTPLLSTVGLFIEKSTEMRHIIDN